MTEKKWLTFDGTTWPAPTGDFWDTINWKLRYAPNLVSREELLAAASVISAYQELVLRFTQKGRNDVCKKIKEKLNEPE